MKKASIFLGIVFCCLSSAQSQSWIASNQISSSVSIFELASDINTLGEVFSFGYFEGTLTSSNGKAVTSYGGRDYYIIKFNTNGTVDWMYNYGSNSNDYITGGVSIDPENNIVATGAFFNFFKYTPTDSIESSGNTDIFLMKLDADGNVLWAKNSGKGAKRQASTSLEVDNSGDILMAGFFVDSIEFDEVTSLYSDNSARDYFYAKFESSTGDILWNKQAKALNVKTGIFTKITHGDDYYVLTGQFIDSIGFENDTISPYNDNLDVHFVKTDIDGTIEWIRKVAGNIDEYSYSVVADDENNLYVAGYFNSDSIFFYETDSDYIEVTKSGDLNDLFIVKYGSNGEMVWYKTMGGNGDEKIYDLAFFDDKVYLSGYFSDTMNWGGIQLISDGPNDRDMFTGALDKSGNFRDANNFSGRNNSTEEARALFQNNEQLFTIMRSNSDLIVLGDSIYTADGVAYNMYIGVIGCTPISIDQVIPQDVQTCYGDSTGAIQILASGGFGAPWQYSIDNGLSYQDAAYFGNIPAGDYPIVVIDAENCAQAGPTETVNQPEQPLSIELISEEFTGDSMVNIVVAAYGGTPPYTYTLQPDGIVQAFGDFSVKWSEPGYYVVEVNDIRNCGPVVTDTLNTSSGIEMFAPGVKLYPNPTSGIITVEVPFQGSACTLEVLSLTGQVMLSRQVYSNGISINETIDLSELSKGMYMIRVDGQTLKSGVVVN